MNSLKYKGYTARIDFDPEDEIFVGRVIGIKDIIGFHSETAKELRQAFEEAVEHYLASCKKLNVKPQKSFSGKFVIRLAPDIHERIALAAAATHKSLNSLIEDILRNHVKAA
ncbi:MAG: type II toxin-antitoxin system HicB family antitoxin [Candidatus Riflebacteria bacterium]|nr:type II toxin-antitoxin system HicB family antitoxin [Candidatus Riflebacteria bacterium]